MPRASHGRRGVVTSASRPKAPHRARSFASTVLVTIIRPAFGSGKTLGPPASDVVASGRFTPAIDADDVSDFFTKAFDAKKFHSMRRIIMNES